MSHASIRRVGQNHEVVYCSPVGLKGSGHGLRFRLRVRLSKE